MAKFLPYIAILGDRSRRFALALCLGSLIGLTACGEDEAAQGMSGPLAVAGPLGDRALGSEKAPVTIVEYASMTCPHCANFDAQTLPQLKKEYIDTGKVRLIFREYPLDPLSTAAFVLARCAEADQYFGFVHVLFARQQQWAYVQSPDEARAQLKLIARQGGFTDEDFENCMKRQDILDHIRDVHSRAANELDVHSTPTIFVNGVKQQTDLSFAEMKEIIDPLLKK